MLAVDTCWLRTNYVKIQKKISSAADDEEMEKLLRDYLNSCPLTVENIAHVFNESLGGYGEIVFVQAKYRFSCHFSELMEEYLNDQKKRAHYWIIHEYFKSDKDVKNILRNELTGSENFVRLKIGVGQKPAYMDDLADWVLSRFTPAEKKLVETAGAHAAEAAKLIVAGQIDRAMNLYNT